MKKIISSFLALSCCFLYGCSSSKGPVSSESLQSSSVPEIVSEVSEDRSAAASSSISPEDQKLLDKISVTCRADMLTDENGKQRMIVDFENTGKKNFSGYILATFVGDSEILGSNVLSVKDLKPGNKGHGDVYITPDSKPVFTYEISNFTFTEDGATSSGSLDEEKSKALTDHMYESFGGSGKKEFAASWYTYIKKIEVFKNESGFYAVATVSTDNDENVKHIGNTIFANYGLAKGNDINLNSTVVQDESGKELFRRSK